jgi:hypothetical protein
MNKEAMTHTTDYSLIKPTEGGPLTFKEAAILARALGATEAKREFTPYLGHYGMRVTGTTMVHRRVARAFYNGGGK